MRAIFRRKWHIAHEQGKHGVQLFRRCPTLHHAFVVALELGAEFDAAHRSALGWPAQRRVEFFERCGLRIFRTLRRLARIAENVRGLGIR